MIINMYYLLVHINAQLLTAASLSGFTGTTEKAPYRVNKTVIFSKKLIITVHTALKFVLSKNY